MCKYCPYLKRVVYWPTPLYTENYLDDTTMSFWFVPGIDRG